MTVWKALTLVENNRHIHTIALNRIERRNAIDHTLANELVDCISIEAQKKELRVLVLTGEGSSFCSGGDLKDRIAFGPGEARRQRDTVLRAIDSLDRFPCPVIAMINGPALAGGLELALACDIRVAADDAVFGLPEVRTAGGFPGAGGPVRLSKLIGRGKTALISFTGRQFSARQAYDMGMVDMIVPAARLRAEAYALAAEIAANSPAGIRAAKQLIRQSLDMDVTSATDLSRALRNPLDDSPDFHEAMNAWREKRVPIFMDLQK